MEGEDPAVPPCTIPERIFKAGEEPTGVRVTPYHKPFGIKQILNVLEPEEIEQIRASPFGKFVELADKPSFSGRFGRYIISRQLKVSKKYEVWFVFAGKPIRFSLREFAIVTGLNCGKFEKRSKKKLANRKLREKPYWGELFGTLKEVPVSSVIRMLRSKGVIRPDLRLKYAYFALLASVILPTTHTPKISEDYAEMIKDIDQFFAYPWGRVAFSMLIGSIKERKEVALSQNTIALKGFVLALQLVMVEAVPALTEVVRDGSSSGSEEDYGQDEETMGEQNAVKRSISPGHARDTDAAGKAIVHSIIVAGAFQGNDEKELEWSDDEANIPVENLTKLIGEGFPFKHSSFVGGVSKLDVIRMREESKQADTRKSKKAKHGASAEIPSGVDVDLISAVVKDSLQGDFSRLENQLVSLRESSSSFQSQVIGDLRKMLTTVEECRDSIGSLANGSDRASGGSVGITNPTTSTRNAATQTNPQTINVQPSMTDGQPSMPDGPTVAEGGVHNRPTTCDVGMTDTDGNDETDLARDRSLTPQSTPSRDAEEHTDKSAPAVTSDSALDPAMCFPDPTFSLGLTQEERAGLEKVVSGCIADVVDEVADAVSEDIACEKVDTGILCRKSKRTKNPPKSLVGNYECDKRFLNLGRATVPDSYMAGGSVDFTTKFSSLLDKMQKPFSIISARWTLESKELDEIINRSTPPSSKVVDVLISHISELYRCNTPQNNDISCLFMDTKFLGTISAAYPNFSKVSKKEAFQFPANVIPRGVEKSSFSNADRLYAPLNVDNKYWVGLCINMSILVIHVLDSNISARTDYMMNKEDRPLAQMFPYLVKQLGKPLSAKELKALAIERPRSIPQTKSLVDSAVASVLLIHAHAVGGVDACKRITADDLDNEVERLAVTLYEGNVGPL